MNRNDALTSSVIRFLRFPLIVMVVMIHSHFKVVSMGGIDYVFDLKEFPIYCNVSFLLSKLMASIAVPMFYVFSGYLFFKNDSSFTVNNYLGKLRKRLKNLLIPYIFWNIVVVLFYFLAQTFMPSMVSGNNKPIVDYNIIDWLRVFWNYQDEMPICYQLWFLRDLMVVVLMSPIIYFAIKKSVFTIFVIGIVWLFGITTGICGIDITAIFFFAIGSAFSIHKYDFVDFCKKIKIAGYIMSLLFIIIEVLIYNKRGSIDLLFVNTQSIVLYKLCTLSLMASCMNITIAIMQKGLLKTNGFLYESNFFIYVCHALPLTLFLKLLIRFVNPASDVQAILIYFAVIIITIIFCLLLFALMRKILPRFTSFILGNRTPQNSTH